MRVKLRSPLERWSCVAVSQRGEWLAAGTTGGSIRLRPLLSSERRLRSWMTGSVQVRTLTETQEGHDEEVSAVAVVVGAEGVMVASGDVGGGVVLQGAGRHARFDVADDAVIAIHWLSDVAAAVAHQSGHLRIVELDGQGKVTEVEDVDDVTAFSVARFDDGALVVVGIADGRVRGCLWSSGGAQWFDVGVAEARPTAAAVALDGTNSARAVVGDENGRIVHYRLRRRESEVSAVSSGSPRAHGGAVLAMGIARGKDGRLVAISSAADQTVQAWSLDGGYTQWAQRGREVAFLAVSSGDDPVLAYREFDRQLHVTPLARYRSTLPFVTRPETTAVSDAPITSDDDDRFDFRTYADALVALIDSPETGTPLVIAIDAPWGAGKSSLANLMTLRLESEQNQGGVKHLTTWFNAWQHDDEGLLPSALARRVAETAAGARPWTTKVTHPVSGGLLERRARRVRVVLLGLAFAVLSFAVAVGAFACWVLAGRPDIGAWATAEDGSSKAFALSIVAGILVTALVGGLAWLRRAGASATRWVRDPENPVREGTMHLVRKDLGDLIAEATQRDDQRSRRLVVFIDDLERCEPRQSVDACKTVNQLLDHENVITVLLVDMRSIAANAECQYHDVAVKVFPETEGAGYGQAFLEKMIQFHFSLPRTAASIDAAATAALVGSESSPDTGGDAPGGLTRFGQWSVARLSSGGRWARRRVGSMLRWPTAVRNAAQGARDTRRTEGTSYWQQFSEWRDRRAPSRGPVLSVVVRVALIVCFWAGVWSVLWGNLRWGVALIGAWLAIGPVRRLLVERAERARRRAEQRRAADERVGAVVSQFTDEEWLSPTKGTERLKRELGSDFFDPMVQQSEELPRANSSPVRRRAEQEADRWIEAIPRKGKRVANHVSVTFAIALEQGLLTGGDEAGKLNPVQIGKWAAFVDRYPGVAREAWRDETLLERLTEVDAAPTNGHGGPLFKLIDAVARATPSLQPGASNGKRPETQPSEIAEMPDEFLNELDRLKLRPADPEVLWKMLREKPRLKDFGHLIMVAPDRDGDEDGPDDATEGYEPDVGRDPTPTSRPSGVRRLHLARSRPSRRRGRRLVGARPAR